MVGTTRKIQVDADTEYTLPATDGSSGDFLKTDGSGTTSWDTVTATAPANTYATKTTSYTATTSDDFLAGNAAGGDFTIALYAASGNAGKVITILNTGASGSVTVDGNASETINGAATFELTKRYQTVTLVCDGSNWNSYSTDNDTVAARMTSSGSYSEDFTSETKLEFDTVTFDTHNGFTDGDDDYTIPVSGYYQINGHINLTTGTNAEVFYFRILIDGVEKIQQQLWFNSVGKLAADMSDLMYLTKGEKVSLAGEITTGSDTTVTVQESIAVTSFSIAKVK